MSTYRIGIDGRGLLERHGETYSSNWPSMRELRADMMLPQMMCDLARELGNEGYDFEMKIEGGVRDFIFVNFPSLPSAFPLPPSLARTLRSFGEEYGMPLTIAPSPEKEYGRFERALLKCSLPLE